MNLPILATCRRAAGWLLGVALLVAGTSAGAQTDPPGRVASLNFHQGTVSFSPAGDDSWYDAVPNRPLTTGDRLWTDANARAELHVGSAAVRLDDRTELDLSELDDDTARLTSMQGSLQVRVRDDLSGQRFEIDTGNLAAVIEAPGEYRIDVDPDSGTTRVAVASGAVTLYGESGESAGLGAHQQLTVSGRNLEEANGAATRSSGAFDAWVAERDRLEDQSVSARYVPRDVIGYQQLDNYGDWQNDPNYGSVWYPRDVDVDWAPYQDGQWVDVAPWGWTWIDAAPWGFAPSHYGRWAHIGPRWGWVPGRPGRRPVYAPALVGFIGGAGANAALPIGGGRSGVGWFPLAPGEAWRPGYRTSQRYIDEANRSALNRQNSARAAEFTHRATPGAVTIVPVENFGRGPISRRDAVRLPNDRMARVPVGSAAPVPLRIDRGFSGNGRPSAAPPAASAARPQPLPMQRPPQNPQAQQQLMEQAQRREVLRQQQMQGRGQTPFEQQRQQVQQAQQAQQAQQMQQREAMRQQQEAQRAAQRAQIQMQRQEQQQQQQAARQQQEMQQRAAQAQMQMQMQQQNAARQAQEVQQQRAAQQRQQLQQRGGRDFPGAGDRPDRP